MDNRVSDFDRETFRQAMIDLDNKRHWRDVADALWGNLLLLVVIGSIASGLLALLVAVGYELAGRGM